MPELPDLVHIAAELRRAVGGQTIVDAQVGDPDGRPKKREDSARLACNLATS